MESLHSVRDHKIPVSGLFYLIYFAVMFGMRAIGIYEGLLIYRILLVVGALFFGIKILMTSHTVFEYLWMGALLILGFIVYRSSGEKGILLYMMLLTGMKDVASEHILKLAAAILAVAFPLLTVLSITGVIDEICFMNERALFGFVLRHSLGYPYPNTMHTTYLILVILITLLYKAPDLRHLLILELFLFAGNVFLFLYGFSNTGLISVTLYLILLFVFSVKKSFGTGFKVFCMALMPVTAAFSILGPVLIKGDAFKLINKILHKRYKYARYFLRHEDITPFGSYFQDPPDKWYMIDNSFLYLFLQLGVVTCLIVSAILLYTVWRLLKDNRWKEIAVFITFCVIGMSDPFLFNLSYKNLLFIFAGGYLFDLSARLVPSGERILGKPDEVTGNLVGVELRSGSKQVPILAGTCQIIPAGSKMISLPRLQETLSRSTAHGDAPYRSAAVFLGRFKETLTSRGLISLATFAVCGLVGAGVFAMLTTAPSALYVDSDTNDPYGKGMDTYTFEPDEVADLKRENILFRYYHDNNTQMYLYTGSAPDWEYIRYLVSMFVFTGLMGVLVVTLINLRHTGSPP